MSHYVLSVTPPTPDCQSGSDDSESEFITNETQYTLTVTAERTYILNISVINSCGDIGEPAEYIIDIAGINEILGFIEDTRFWGWEVLTYCKGAGVPPLRDPHVILRE